MSNYARIVMVLYSAFLLVGCASVDVISGVAGQNKRNAQALDTNLKTFLTQQRKVMEAWLEMFVILEEERVLKGVNRLRTNNLQLATVVAKLQVEAAALDAQTGVLAQSAKQAQIRHLRTAAPLPAAVQFDNIDINMAAQKYILVKKSYDLPGKTAVEKFKLAMGALRDLPVLVELHQAKSDVLKAYKTMETTILSQSAIGVTISEQLVNASEAGTKAGAFLQGVTENTELLGLIGTIVESQTGNPERRKAAQELIQSLKTTTASP